MMSKTPTIFSPPTEQQKNNFKQANNFFSLGKVLAKKGEWSKAIATYQKAIKLAPDWEEVKQYLTDAENQLQKIANVQNQEKISNQLITVIQEQKLENITNINRVEVDEKLAENYHLQGDALVEKGEKAEAIKIYRKAVEIKPELWEVHHKLGNLLQEIGQLKKAVDAYNKSIELKPNFCWSYNNLGDVLVRLGKSNEAIKSYQKAIALEANFPWSYYNLAELCFLLEKWDEAVNAYRQFMQIKPDFSPKVEEKLNQALHQQVQGKLEKALSHYQQAIENDPTDIESYEKALEIKPDSAELYLGLGHAWIAKGQSEKAILAYKKAIDENPDIFIWSRHNLEKTMQVGGLEEAFDAFRQAAKLNSQFPTQEVEKNKQDLLQFDTQNNTLTKTVFSTTKKNILSNPQFLNSEEINICNGNIAPRNWELVIRPEWQVETQFVSSKDVPEINKELVDHHSFFYIKIQDVKKTNPRSYLRQIVKSIKVFENTIITSSIQLCLQNTNRSEIIIAIFADEKLTNKLYQLSTKVHSNSGWSTTNISIDLNKVVNNLPEEVHIAFYINLPTTSGGNLWLAFSELIVIDVSSGFKPINFSFFPFGNYSKASARLRTWKLVDCLRKAGHLVTIGYSEESDVYVFQKLRPFDRLNDKSKMQLREFKDQNKVIVYDFDDNYVLPSQGTQEELVAFMNSVDVVTVGSKLLADFANKYHPNVFVLENPVDINTDDIVRNPTPELKNIGWFGAPEGILQIENVNIEEKITTITKGGDIEFDINTVDRTLTEFDLLIFPLEPTEWNLAKNANRMIKAIALGVPVLATATPEHRRVAREFNLSNHFLVNYDGNWNEKLAYLKENFAQVQEEILIARQRALEIYSTQKITKNWFNNVLGSQKRWIPTQVKRNFTKTYQKNFLSQVAVLIYDYSVTKTFTTCIQESEVNWSDFGSQYIVAAAPYEQELLKIESYGFQYLFPENDYLEIFKYFQQIITEANQEWILLVSGNCILTQGIYEELERHLSKSDAEPVLLLKVQSYGCLPDIQPNSIFDGIKLMSNPNTPDVMLIKRSWVKPYVPLIQKQLNYWGWNITLMALNNQERNNCCHVNIPVILRGNCDIDSNLSRQYVKWLEIFPPKIPPQMPDITNQWRRIKHDIIQGIVTNFPDILPTSFASALEKINILDDELNRLKKK